MATAEIIDLKKKAEQTRPIAQKEPKDGVSRDALPQSLSWEAPEFTTYEKSRMWHIALFAIAGIVISAMIALKNYSAAAFFALAAAVIYLYAGSAPRLLKFTINSKGVEVAGRLYLYDGLRSFWIFYEPHSGRAELSLRSNKVLMPYIRVPLGSVNPAAAHRVLSRFLPERKHTDSMVDAMSRKAGF